MPVQYPLPCNVVEVQQILPGVGTQDDIRIFALECVCLPALFQCQADGVSEIVLTLCVGLRQAAQQFQQRLCAEPVHARIDLLHSTLCVCCVLFLHNGCQTVFAPQNPAVSLRLFQLCGNNCNGVFFCFMKLQRIGDSLTVNKRCISVENQRVAVLKLPHKALCLHDSMPGSQLFCLERRAIAIVQIHLHILGLIAGDNADPAETCALAGTDHPTEHGDIQHPEHRLRDSCLHTISMAAGQYYNLIHGKNSS